MANTSEVTESKRKLDANVQNMWQIVAKKYVEENYYSNQVNKIDEKDINNLKLLMKFNPDLNALTSNGENLLHLAIKNGRSVKMVEFITKLLSDNGVDINLVNKEGHNALQYALFPISIDCKEKSQYDPDTVIKYSDFTFRFIDVAIIQHLIEKGAKVDKIDKNGYNPILKAVVMQKTDYVEVILENKDKLMIGGLEQTVCTFLFDRKEIIRDIFSSKEKTVYTYPFKKYYGMTPLLIAVNDNNMEMVQMLIEAGANVNAIVNAPNSNRDNALHLLTKASKGNSRYEMGKVIETQTLISKLLIDSGIDLNVKDGSGKTALQLAIRHEKHDIVTHILAKGVDTLLT